MNTTSRMPIQQAISQPDVRADALLLADDASERATLPPAPVYGRDGRRGADSTDAPESRSAASPAGGGEDLAGDIGRREVIDVDHDVVDRCGVEFVLEHLEPLEEPRQLPLGLRDVAPAQARL